MEAVRQVVHDIGSILPIVILWVTAIVILLLAPLARRGVGWHVPGLLSTAGILAALAALIRRTEGGFGTGLFAGALYSDTLSTAGAFVLLLAGLLAVLVAQGYLRSRGIEKPEYYALLLLSLSGAYLMLLASDLLVLFLALELMSFGFYVLAGFERTSSRSEEAALKYFLTGAFASALFLYGLMLAFGVAGSSSFEYIQAAVGRGALKTPMGLAAAALLLAGLGFKVAAVPFHQWTPDVYEGSPTSSTAFFAATAKIGAFVAMIRVLDMLAGGSQVWLPAVRLMAIVTMLFGNVLALSQMNVKRMLGYSAIAHAGYLLAAMVCVGMRYVSAEGARSGMPAMNATVFYLLAYALATIGAFGVLAYMSARGRDVQTLDHLRGLVRTDPAAAYAMMLFMLSLAGIPATAGFIAKWQVFYAVVIAGDIPLAVTIALASAVGAYYYLRVVWYMVFDESTTAPVLTEPGRTPAAVAIYISAFATVLLGVVPGFLMGFLSVVR